MTPSLHCRYMYMHCVGTVFCMHMHVHGLQLHVLRNVNLYDTFAALQVHEHVHALCGNCVLHAHACTRLTVTCIEECKPL